MNCRTVRPQLSAYIDNALSARATWEVDRHLNECHECTRALNELRRTVSLLAAAPRAEVSNDFLTRLQARIEQVDPAPARRAWMSGLGELFRPRIRPVWGAGLATAALAAILFLPSGARRSPAPMLPAQQGESAAVQSATRQNLGLQAADPFADIAAANLTSHVSTDLRGDSESLN